MANTTPPFKPLVSTADRQRIFGKFDYKVNGDGSIRILGDWANKNVIKVHIPQLEGIEGAPANCIVWFHRLGARQLQSLFDEWDAEGLMPLVLSWAGSFVPRMIRGSKTTLSNHAFGTAFDINAAWNPLGKEPAKEGEKGSVRELVEIAHKHGFFWGGNFSRKDGMHFELAVLQSERAASGDDIQQDAVAFPNSPTPPAEATTAKPETVAIEKPAPVGFGAKIKKQITALTGGGIGADMLTEKAAQAQALGLSAEMWKRIFWLAVAAAVVYLAYMLIHHILEVKRDKEITKELIAANTTTTNTIMLVNRGEAATGHKVVTR